MKHQPIYREVLGKAWELTWRHKRLWLFGFFATFLQTSGVVEIVFRAMNRIPQEGWNLVTFSQNAYPGAAFVTALSIFRDGGGQLTPMGGLIILGFVAAIIVFLWFVSSSAGSLIWSVHQAGRKAPSIEKSFMEGRKSGWRIAGLIVLSKLVLAALFLLISLPLLLVFQSTTTSHVLLYMILFLIFFPIVLVVSFMTIYALCAVALDKKHFFPAIEESWYLFRQHWLVSLETAVILFLVGIVGAAVMIITSYIISIPFFLLMTVSVLAGSKILFTSVVITALILVAMIVIVVGSMVTTFQLITWSLLYKRLQRAEAIPKLVRFLRRIPKLFLHRT